MCRLVVEAGIFAVAVRNDTQFIEEYSKVLFELGVGNTGHLWDTDNYGTAQIISIFYCIEYPPQVNDQWN